MINGDNKMKVLKFLMFILLATTILSCYSINKPECDGVTKEPNFWEPTTSIWEPNTNPFNSNYVGGIAVANNGDIWTTVYHSVREDFFSTVHLSTDNGDTWVQRGVFFTSLGQIFINPFNGYLFVTTSWQGMFRSTDNGENWVKVITDNITIYDVLFTLSGEMYIGVEYTEFFEHSWKGFYYSNNNGDTWIEKGNGLTNVYSLALGTDGTLYISLGVFGARLGVCRSTDGGDTWSPPSNYNDILVHKLAVSDDGSIFATTTHYGVLKSIDRGVTWTQVNTGLYNLETYVIIYNPISKDIFISVGINNRVYRSTDLGASWKLEHSGLSRLGLVGIFAVNHNTGQMYVACYDNGIYRSINYP